MRYVYTQKAPFRITSSFIALGNVAQYAKVHAANMRRLNQQVKLADFFLLPIIAYVPSNKKSDCINSWWEEKQLSHLLALLFFHPLGLIWVPFSIHNVGESIGYHLGRISYPESATPRCKQCKNSLLSQASLQSRYIMVQARMNDITGSPAITNPMSFTTSWQCLTLCSNTIRSSNCLKRRENEKRYKEQTLNKLCGLWLVGLRVEKALPRWRNVDKNVILAFDSQCQREKSSKEGKCEPKQC